MCSGYALTHILQARNLWSEKTREWILLPSNVQTFNQLYWLLLLFSHCYWRLLLLPLHFKFAYMYDSPTEMLTTLVSHTDMQSHSSSYSHHTYSFTLIDVCEDIVSEWVSECVSEWMRDSNYSKQLTFNICSVKQAKDTHTNRQNAHPNSNKININILSRECLETLNFNHFNDFWLTLFGCFFFFFHCEVAQQIKTVHMRTRRIGNRIKIEYMNFRRKKSMRMRKAVQNERTGT